VNPLDVMRYGQETIDQLIDRLRPGDWQRIALGEWTTKDVVGHLGAFEVRFAEILVVFGGETPTTNLRAESPATFNDDQAARRKGWPVDQVVTELRDAHRLVMDCAARLPAETWSSAGSIPWYGPEYALDDLLVYSMYGHKREHGPQLEAILNRTGPGD
jgi:uncharacterized protein (TIGR03083 family)